MAVEHLQPSERELVFKLAREITGTAFSEPSRHEVIITNVWGDDESFSNTVNFHVTALRKKIDAEREHPLIQTVHGFGYRMREPMESS